MEEVLQAIPQNAQENEIETEENISEVVSEFFGLVGGARLEEDVRLDLHLPTGDIIARHVDENSVARLRFEGGLTAEEITPDTLREMQRENELENISRPTSTVNVVHD